MNPGYHFKAEKTSKTNSKIDLPTKKIKTVYPNKTTKRKNALRSILGCNHIKNKGELE